MSDAFGQDDTASGGLVNDMPGLMQGAAGPRGPRQVPNALGSIASAAQQLLGIGRPAPMPLGPAPSMFGGPPPQQPQPPSDRWTGTTASLGLPRGAPQPPAKFTPYIRSQPNRPYSQWGDVGEFPSLPTSFEVPSVLSGVSRFFGQNGSALSIPLALMMGRYAGDFMKGLQQGQEFKTKMAMDGMKEAAMQLQLQQETEHHAYADILSQYAVESNSTDPNSMTGTVNGVGLRDALMNQANQLGDTQMAQLLADGKPISQIMWFQQQRDAHLQDLQKANKASDAQDAADAEKWGIPPDPNSQTGQRGAQPEAQAPGATSPGGGVGTQGQPAPTQPGQPGGTQVASNDPSSGLVQPDPNTKLLPYQQIGLDMARGQPAETTGLPKKVISGAREYEADVNSRLNDVVAHSAGKSRDQISSELNAISPAIGADFGRLVDGKMGVPGGMGAVGARPYWSNMQNLAVAVKPSWSPTDFTRISELNKEYDAGPTGRRMGRTESMAAAGRTLLQALQQIPEGETPPEGALSAWYAGTLSGDSKWGRVFAAYNTYVQEAQSIASQTGNFHEGDVKRVMENTNFKAGPEFLRGSQLMVDAQNAVDTMHDFNEDYKRYTGHDALHYNPQAVATLQTIASYDPKTNRFATVLDPRLQGLDRSYDAQPGAAQPGQPGAAAPAPQLDPGWSLTPP